MATTAKAMEWKRQGQRTGEEGETVTKERKCVQQPKGLAQLWWQNWTEQQSHKEPHWRVTLQGKIFILRQAGNRVNYSWLYSSWKKVCKGSKQDLLKQTHGLKEQLSKSILVIEKVEISKTHLNWLLNSHVKCLDKALANRTDAWTMRTKKRVPHCKPAKHCTWNPCFLKV